MTLTEDELARPLNADTEAYWRKQVAERKVDPDEPWRDAEVLLVVVDLLAALDAARADTAGPDAPLFFEPCRDFDKPQSCYTNDGTGLWCDPCRERRRIALIADTAGIDAAWAEAEAALPPDGWITVSGVSRVGYNVEAWQPWNSIIGQLAKVFDHDLAAALLALAAALRTPKPEGEPE